MKRVATVTVFLGLALLFLGGISMAGSIALSAPQKSHTKIMPYTGVGEELTAAEEPAPIIYIDLTWTTGVGETSVSDATKFFTVTGIIYDVTSAELVDGQVTTDYSFELLNEQGVDVLRGYCKDTEFSATRTSTLNSRTPLNQDGISKKLTEEKLYGSVSSAGASNTARIRIGIKQIP